MTRRLAPDRATPTGTRTPPGIGLRAGIGAAVLLAGIGGIGLGAAPAAAAPRLCSRDAGDAVSVCVRVTPSAAPVGTGIRITGAVGPNARKDPTARRGVCLYRLRTGQRPTTVTPAERMPICAPLAADGTYAMTAFLGRYGTFTYVVAARDLGPGVGAARPIASPGFVVDTTL